MKINENNVALKLKEEMFYILASKNEEQRNIKEALEAEKNTNLEANKIKM